MNTEFFWTFAGYCCMKSGDHCDMNTDSRADSQQVQNSVDGDGGEGGTYGNWSHLERSSATLG